MKKLLLIILQCLLCMLLCSCGETYADTLADYYEERLSDYEEIVHTHCKTMRPLTDAGKLSC